jgi:hypothetical protein
MRTAFSATLLFFCSICAPVAHSSCALSLSPFYVFSEFKAAVKSATALQNTLKRNMPGESERLGTEARSAALSPKRKAVE